MSTLEPLGEQECLELLGSSRLGRLGVVIDQYPMILPVNYALDEDRVTFRTDPDTKFNAAHYSNVSFQVDAVDLTHGSGWSVLVLGAVHVVDVTDVRERDRVEQLGVKPMAPGEKTIWVQIVPNRISGRRIASDDMGFAFDAHAYL